MMALLRKWFGRGHELAPVYLRDQLDGLLDKMSDAELVAMHDVALMLLGSRVE